MSGKVLRKNSTAYIPSVNEVQADHEDGRAQVEPPQVDVHFIGRDECPTWIANDPQVIGRKQTCGFPAEERTVRTSAHGGERTSVSVREGADFEVVLVVSHPFSDWRQIVFCLFLVGEPLGRKAEHVPALRFSVPILLVIMAVAN